MRTLTHTEVMATHYCEFTCLRDAEISTGFLMGRLMHALHLTMVGVACSPETDQAVMKVESRFWLEDLH